MIGNITKWVWLARLTPALVTTVLAISTDTLDVADGKGTITAPNVYAALRGMSGLCVNNISPQLFVCLFVYLFFVFVFSLSRFGDLQSTGV